MKSSEGTSTGLAAVGADRAATGSETEPSGSTRVRRRRLRRLSSESGAVGTEMAIVVAIVVAISVALGIVMTTSAQNHQNCIPTTPGATVPAGC
jgi:hypothetical protein